MYRDGGEKRVSHAAGEENEKQRRYISFFPLSLLLLERGENARFVMYRLSCTCGYPSKARACSCMCIYMYASLGFMRAYVVVELGWDMKYRAVSTLTSLFRCVDRKGREREKCSKPFAEVSMVRCGVERCRYIFLLVQWAAGGFWIYSKRNLRESVSKNFVEIFC